MTSIAWSKEMVFCARFLVGLMHAPMYVYASVWVDTFAPSGSETRWMGVLSTIGPVGNLFSYGVTACLVPCCGYYASCGAQYWAEDMLIHMGVPEKEAPYKFLTVGVLGPTLGMAVSGPLFDCLGGYRNRRRTMWFCAAFIFLTFPCAPWLLFSEEVDSLMTAVLYSMFLFGLVIPPMQGLVMDSVPAHQKPHASAVYGFLTDALGFMLAPSLIGVATDWWGIAVGWRWGFYPALFSPWILLAALGVDQEQQHDDTDGLDEYNGAYSVQDVETCSENGEHCYSD